MPLVSLKTSIDLLPCSLTHVLYIPIPRPGKRVIGERIYNMKLIYLSKWFQVDRDTVLPLKRKLGFPFPSTNITPSKFFFIITWYF